MTKRKKIVILCVFLLLAASIIWLVSARRSDSRDTEKQNGGKTTSQQYGAKSNTANSSKTTTNNAQSTDSSGGAAPAAPFGTFISNHRPNLDGQPAPNAMNSVCQTTPGATCEITFTKDGVTKTLGPKTANTAGYADWDWKLQDIDLSEGSWQVEATAKNGSKAISVKDPTLLEVGP